MGVKLVSAKEFIPDGSGGIIMAGMIETVAEWYSANLSENVTRGMYENGLEKHNRPGICLSDM